jgi:small-conductance mechanosensitive channel
MNFVHLSILAGLASVSIPLMLHMLGRKQPQLVDFPALRFVRQTQLEQSSSWKLRHFLLLLLRILLFAVLVLALARPRVHSASMGSMVGIAGLIILAVLASLAAAIAWASRRPFTVWGLAVLVAIALWSGVAAWGYRALTLGPALPTSDTSAPVAVGLIVDTSPTMNYQFNNKTRLQAAREMATWIGCPLTAM